MSRKNKNPDKKWLLIRYGGLGDSLFITAPARALQKLGYHVSIACPEAHRAIYQGLKGVEIIPLIRRAVFNRSRFGAVNLARTDDGHLVPIESIFEQFKSDDPRRPFNVTDFMHVIESNTQRPHLGATQNSDFVNTYEMHMGWCGIDHTTLAAEDMRPFYSVTDAEREWAEKELEGLPRPVVMVQTGASSPARTYMRGRKTAHKIIQDGATVLFWNGTQWHYDGANLALPEGMDPIRATGALVSVADLVVSVDTFISHLAEAVGTKHLTLYSTVPSWTRSRYYQNEITVDACSAYCKQKNIQPCYCHVITNGRCPKHEKDIAEKLDNFDRLALASLPMHIKQDNGVQPWIRPDEGFEPPALMEGGIQAMQEAALNKWNTLRHAESYCIAAVDLFKHYKDWRQSYEG